MVYRYKSKKNGRVYILYKLPRGKIGENKSRKRRRFFSRSAKEVPQRIVKVRKARGGLIIKARVNKEYIFYRDIRSIIRRLRKLKNIEEADLPEGYTIAEDPRTGRPYLVRGDFEKPSKPDEGIDRDYPGSFRGEYGKKR